MNPSDSIPPMNRKEHWEKVYQTNEPNDVSWFQTRPATSLKLIEATGVSRNADIIDVGGGASVLVDFLLDAGFTHLAVLDISAAALAQAQKRLGGRVGRVQWLNADVTAFDPPHRFALWHDRAVFHFLTDQNDRRKYVGWLNRAISPGGHVIIGTFAIDGPRKCSGLEVVRYDSRLICAELGESFQLVEQADETHTTPWETKQKFSYFRFARKGAQQGSATP